MSMPRWSSLALVFAVVLAASQAGAAPYDNQPKLLIHVVPAARGNTCQAGVLSDCRTATVEQFLSTAEGPFFHAYLLVARGSMPSIAGVQCGITYENGQPGDVSNGAGIDVFRWTRCADVEMTTAGMSSWPAPGSGNMLTWDPTSHCQYGEVAVAGYFYLAAYSADRLQITRRPVDAAAVAADCNPAETVLGGDDLGFAAFSAEGATAGCNPCSGPCPDPPTPPFLPPVPPPPPPTTEAAPRILLHVGSPVTRDQCGRGALADPATAVVSAGLSSRQSGPFFFVYLLVAREKLAGVAGVQCGISYENNKAGATANGTGIDIFSWTRCATAEWPTPGAVAWPAPGTGNLITWDMYAACQTGPTAVAGYFYLAAYSADRLSLTTRPHTTTASVADCEGAEYEVGSPDLGYVTFSAQAATPGCNPWLRDCTKTVPVEVVTWGGIKALYAR